MGIGFIVIYTLVILWWAYEYGRPGWRGVTQRRMRYVSLAKAKVAEINDRRYAEGQEALMKGGLFLGALAAMLIGWVFLLVGLVAVGG
jgi:hypothetical protein